MNKSDLTDILKIEYQRLRDDRRNWTNNLFQLFVLLLTISILGIASIIQFGQEDEKINIQHGLIGLPVFLIFVYSLFFFNWTEVLIYTIAIRIGVFFILQLLKSIFRYIQMFLGIGQFIFKITSVGSFIYFLFDNVFS